jgi:hypothetical protein
MKYELDIFLSWSAARLMAMSADAAISRNIMENSSESLSEALLLLMLFPSHVPSHSLNHSLSLSSRTAFHSNWGVKKKFSIVKDKLFSSLEWLPRRSEDSALGWMDV